MTTPKATRSISVQLPRPRKILIASPAYKSLYTASYVLSLFNLVNEARNRSIATAFAQVDFADIVSSRNYLASQFYFDFRSCSHLLFLDNDMGYSASLIMDMLELNVDVSGVIYPKRQINLEKLHASGSKPFRQAYAESCEFIGQTNLPNQRGTFIKVKRIGTGILLIKRETIAKMIERCPEISKTKLRKESIFGKLGGYITPFNKVEVNGEELSEDFSFCHRWTEQCGGTIMASTSSPIKHVGEMTIETKLSDTWET